MSISMDKFFRLVLISVVAVLFPTIALSQVDVVGHWRDGYWVSAHTRSYPSPSVRRIGHYYVPPPLQGVNLLIVHDNDIKLPQNGNGIVNRSTFNYRNNVPQHLQQPRIRSNAIPVSSGTKKQISQGSVREKDANYSGPGGSHSQNQSAQHSGQHRARNTSETFLRVYTCKVIDVIDGDTIVVLFGRQEVKIRLYGIDAPEILQQHGFAARDRLHHLIMPTSVIVKEMGKDGYGRVIGLVEMQDGSIVNHIMLKEGLAWWYMKYAPADSTLMLLQNQARKLKLGLWGAENPVPPWDYRK